ncbi:MAG: MopE-related protein [Archangium sp.]
MRQSSRLLLAVSVLLAACSSNPPATGALRVEVEFNSSLSSRCVKVTATDGEVTRETNPLVLAGKTSPLIVAIYPEGMLSRVDVQALGYSDEACTQRTTPLEQTDRVEGEFAEPYGTVKLVLARERPDAGTDAGIDAGTDAGVDGGTDAGIDGGTDGGFDTDMDGWNDDVDCQPNNPAVHPDAGETCSDGIDNDCNALADCTESPKCDGTACPNGMCVAGGCVQPTESMCNDGFDNDGDNRADCLDPDCTGLSCNDGSGCTSGDTCAVDGGCQAAITEMCNQTRVCFATPGMCNPDGGMCSYTPLTQGPGSCNDDNLCTDQDACTDGVCAGQMRTCSSPPACFGNGRCESSDGGCVYSPLAATSPCTDGNSCTTNDRCDGDGGCIGDAPTCTPPTNCHAWDNTCQSDGGCNWVPVSGGSCDAGNGAPGICGMNFICDPVQAALFPFTPSNFTEAQLAADAGVATNFTASFTLNTTNITATAGQQLPPSTVVNNVLVFRTSSFSMNGGVTMTITGNRPVIFAVTGNATIPATAAIIARSGSGAAACGNGGDGNDSGGGAGGPESGGGGGGFGTAGGSGGPASGHSGAMGASNGTDDLIPLRGGCRGGHAQPTNTQGGAGGGAIQFSVAGTLTVGGQIGAPGRTGGGAPTQGNGGGGGGSGGAVLLEANVLTLQSTARVTANGGGGGEGSRGAAGNSGEDGHTDDASPAEGGRDGSDAGGNGGNGAAGNTGATNGGAPTMNDAGGGGGGGGHGRIRFNPRTTCTVPANTVSPAYSPGGSVPCTP